MIQEDPNRSKQVRLEAWRILEEYSIFGDVNDKLQTLGLSEQDIEKIRLDFIEGSVFAPSKLSGKITELPKLLKDHKGRLLGGMLPSMVQSYVGWMTYDHETNPQHGKLSHWVDFWGRGLGNTPDETRQLMTWMQENPFEVADYLDRVWFPEFSKELTDPFRVRAYNGTLPRLDFEK